MDGISSVIIRKALDGLSMRSLATAQNIASASARGYRPIKVDFEDSLKAAAGQGADAVEKLSLGFSDAAPSALGGEPRLDLELATASETAMRYSALVDMLGRQLSIVRTAVRGGQ